MRCVAFAVVLTACARSSSPATEPEPDAPPAAVDARVEVDAPAATSTTLKVATFNLLHGFPTFENLEQRTDIVVDWITAVQPDLVAIQEAAISSTSMNRGEIIAQRTSYQWAWTKAAGFAGVFEEGPGVLSRVAMTSHDGTMLPHVVNTFGVRSATRVEIETPVGRVAIVSAHIGGDDPPATIINADQAMAARDFLMGSTAVAHFLCGDMNANPDEAGMVALRGQFDDAWMRANPNDPGYTSDAANPTHRIDYIYVDKSVEVLGCELLFAAPVSGILASDHLGVMCTIRIKKPS
jgi:endonuclease/exonuclease/phosphatase family metal-dependent hydrolase